MKFYVDLEERWPDYILSTDKTPYDLSIELTEDEYADFLGVEDDYNKWQIRIDNELSKQLREVK